MFTSLLRLWAGPLPQEELFPSDRQVNPLLHWFIHPLKRHFARIYIRLLQRFFGLKVIAIGGSNGKTTTRTLLLYLLSQYGSTVATRDSITSTYNIPTSILRCRPWTKYFICEMSIEYIGDMNFYLWLVQPNLAILTLIELEHTHYFTSLSQVAHEENLLVTRGNWPTITNGNSPAITADHTHRRLLFGTSPQFAASIVANQFTSTLQSEIKIRLSQDTFTYQLPPGAHYAPALAACLLALHSLGLDPHQAKLNHFSPPPHRFTLNPTSSGHLIIDDTYNSNPSSAHLALQTATELARLAHRPLAVILSQMNELGPHETSEHQKLGSLLKHLRPYLLLCVGPASRTTLKSAGFGHYYNSTSALQAALKTHQFKPNSLILVKSSRSWKLEQIVSQLQTQL